MKTVMSIDPGRNLGVCLWDADAFRNKTAIPLWYKTYKFDSLPQYWETLDKLITSHGVTQAFSEDAEYMEDSEKGRIAARAGDLVKLVKFVGNLEQLFYRHGVPLTLISVMRWKGNIPKDKLFQQMFTFWTPVNRQASHALDAVGIGFALQGRL